MKFLFYTLLLPRHASLVPLGQSGPEQHFNTKGLWPIFFFLPNTNKKRGKKSDTLASSECPDENDD